MRQILISAILSILIAGIGFSSTDAAESKRIRIAPGENPRFVSKAALGFQNVLNRLAANPTTNVANYVQKHWPNGYPGSSPDPYSEAMGEVNGSSWGGIVVEPNSGNLCTTIPPYGNFVRGSNGIPIGIVGGKKLGLNQSCDSGGGYSTCNENSSCADGRVKIGRRYVSPFNNRYVCIDFTSDTAYGACLIVNVFWR